ncbi:DUF1611 domain-containing protein [Euzebya rosea]|uniref:DUF1611 domain-containing protein n=1 Tax=Euzebya rosea TaxID=2052804 RepID=UPI000D3EA87C|nr:DUF1611 domain-containing protein [Euzebya rosea]
MSTSTPLPRPTAVVYCDHRFGDIDGKTANGLVRHSETYEVLSVIDSQQAGADTGTVLDGIPNGIPVVASLQAALDQAQARTGTRPDAMIIGVAPSSGLLDVASRTVLLAAVAAGLDLVNGLHEFLNDDPEFAGAAIANEVEIRDIRRPRATKDLRMFTGRIREVTCPVIAVLGTDGAIGKRTTATILVDALRAAGINAVMVSTGQTGLIQGARFGIALDAIPAQFGIGEMEGVVLDAFSSAAPDVIVVEGQGALSHPAYISSTIVLRGSRPDGVILQHAPGRTVLSDFPDVDMPTPASEIALIHAFADTSVIGVTINHEHLSEDEVSAAISDLEHQLSVPVTDALTRPVADLVAMVVTAFPTLRPRVPAGTG